MRRSQLTLAVSDTDSLQCCPVLELWTHLFEVLWACGPVCARQARYVCSRDTEIVAGGRAHNICVVRAAPSHAADRLATQRNPARIVLRRWWWNRYHLQGITAWPADSLLAIRIGECHGPRGRGQLVNVGRDCLLLRIGRRARHLWPQVVSDEIQHVAAHRGSDPSSSAGRRTGAADDVKNYQQQQPG